MEITNDLIEHIAHLARLEFNGEENERIKADLENIISFVDQLQKVDTEGLEPLVYMTEEINVLREDTPAVTVTQEEALKNAPNKDSDYFKIPKVLKG
ncbi:MAG: Asp-tRNA(Asn)/Glu-tRNA(Gln) amidotransferase subunit GatC [Crocinitomicaceae bacterium]|nr:Asp-tRNA(Asn)/Glu-tRNA(Gln) amidotransferase subunit GatC [Crocinitomicaceae bacterium]